MNRTQKYIAAIVLLLLANMLLLFSEELFGKVEPSRRYFDFAGQDVVELAIANKEDTVRLTKSEEVWRLNNRFRADNGFVKTLLSVLQRLEKSRSLSAWNGEVLGRITVRTSDGSEVTLQYGSDPNRTKTYFLMKDEKVQVSVPGYRDNVADLFLLHPDQWRDRLIFDGSWRTIQKVEVDQGEDSFEIQFQDDFFLLDGQSPQDSSAVIEYLNQFQFFQANEMISEGRFVGLDSISNNPPIARVLIDDIKSDTPRIFRIYPSRAGQRYHLVMDEQGQRMVIDATRIEQILTTP